MSISNSQYDAIMREYEELRRKSHYEAEAHKEEVYKRIPEYKEIEQKIADIAMEKKTGARALRSIIEELMLDVMYEVPKDDNIGSVTITEEYVNKKGAPIIEMRG